MKKILICAVPYSDNLGDGVIAHSLEHIVRLKYPDAQVHFLDIAGRRGFEGGKLREGWGFTVFQKSPRLLRAAAVLLLCVRNFFTRWRAEWRKAVQDADLVIVGGGQLLCDVSLNFPMKLFLLGTLLRAKDTIVLSVGMTAKWSTLGKYLIGRFLSMAQPRFIATRDTDSLTNLRSILRYPEEKTAIIHDPALTCADAFAKPKPDQKHWDVGICISNLDALVMNSEYTHLHHGASADFFPRLAKSLSERGKSVVVFTNGAAEDNAVARHFVTLGAISEADLTIPDDPTELVSIIARCRSVVAHRLHANIVAYGQGVPSVALDWDKKVDSFLRLTGRSEFLYPLSPDIEDVESAVLALLAGEHGSDRLAELKAGVIRAVHSVI